MMNALTGKSPLNTKSYLLLGIYHVGTCWNEYRSELGIPFSLERNKQGIIK